MYVRFDRSIRKDITSCLLCHNPRCTAACARMDVGRILRALYFDNIDAAAAMLPEDYDRAWLEEAERVCPAGVRIGHILDYLASIRPGLEGIGNADQISLACDICGVPLQNPFLLSSSVVGINYEMVARAFEMGWAGVSYKTICLMDIHETSPRFSAVRDPGGKWYGFKNIEQLSDHSLEENMDCFRRLKANYPDKAILASIMGRNEEEWERLAREVTAAGADVIECNYSCPNMEEKGTGSDIGQSPETVRRYTAAVRRATDIPILVKMTPNITDMRVPALAAVEAGADGIAAINTFKSITGVNIDTLVPMPTVHGRSMLGGYSGPAVKPIALRFVAEMAEDERLKHCHISGMGGVQTWRDAVEFLLLGAGSIQVTTAIMEYGYRIIDDLALGLKIYMAQRGYTDLRQFVGSALPALVQNDEMERDTVVYPVIDRDRCNGCGRCYISCRDGGHQALVYHEDTGKVTLNGKKCVGCQLCSLVCPTEAISQSKRVRKRVE